MAKGTSSISLLQMQHLSIIRSPRYLYHCDINNVVKTTSEWNSCSSDVKGYNASSNQHMSLTQTVQLEVVSYLLCLFENDLSFCTNDKTSAERKRTDKELGRLWKQAVVTRAGGRGLYWWKQPEKCQPVNLLTAYGYPNKVITVPAISVILRPGITYMFCSILCSLYSLEYQWPNLWSKDRGVQHS